MADQVTSTAPVAPTPAPAVESPVVTTNPEPVAPAVVEPVVTPTPEPIVEQPKEEPKTALGKIAEPVKEEAPQDPAAEPSAEPTADAPQSDEPAPLPTYEPFTLPEGVTPDEEGFGNLNKMLGEFEHTTKADHAEVQKLGQHLVDRHVQQLQTTIEKVHEANRLAWENTKEAWKQSFINDSEIGGNRQETTVNAALQFIRNHGGSEAQQNEFRELMETSGVGNHPAMIRLLAKANMAMSEGKPLPAKSPAPAPQSKPKRWYGKQ